MHVKNYIQATYEVLQKKLNATDTLHALSKYLKKRGLQKLYPAILKGIGERMRRSTRASTANVIVARSEDLHTYKREIESQVQKLQENSTYTHTIDADIIGGYIIEGASNRIDASYKNKLLSTYHRLTASNN